MNAVVYSEPYKLPAGILAMVVHGVFFALLYFGFAWQTQSSGAMSVDLWQSLPGEVEKTRVAEAVQPLPEKVVKPEVVQPPRPEKVVEPDIALPEKKKTEVKPVAAKPEKKKPVPRIAEMIAKSAGQKTVPSIADQAAREQGEREAAIGRIVDEHIGRIIGKIRRNVVMPPDVESDARAEFSVTLLPGGAVMNARLIRSSGNAAYDSAVERAILKSQPLPLPADVTMFNRFRELKLVFKPVE